VYVQTVHDEPNTPIDDGSKVDFRIRDGTRESSRRVNGSGVLTSLKRAHASDKSTVRPPLLAQLRRTFGVRETNPKYGRRLAILLQ